MRSGQTWVLRGLAFALVLLVAGCGMRGSASGRDSWPNTVQITRLTDVSGNHFPPFSQTVNNPADAQSLYRFIQGLPAFPGTISCPLDSGLYYRLTFSGQGKANQEVTARGSGCRQVVVRPGDLRQSTDAFWSELAQSTGVSEADFFVQPPR
ncbi:MAG TPA: hypothetical protein VF818_00530 [Ktedonobacterales bacterium]